MVAGLLPLQLQRCWLLLRADRRRLATIGIIILVALIFIFVWRAPSPPQDEAQDEPPVHEFVEQAFEKQIDRSRRLWLSCRAPWEIKKSGQLLIPPNIHHYFSNDSGLAARLLPAVSSWAKHHKQYTVYLWDAAHVERRLLPKYANCSRYYWHSATGRQERDLLAKVLILYETGGVIVDPHLEALASITEYISDVTCMMAQERTEKAILMYGLEELPSASLMACQARHEFLRFFLRKITDVAFRTGGRVLNVRSVKFIAHVYVSSISAFDDACMTLSCDFRDRLQLAEPDVVLPLIEPGIYDSFLDNCKAAVGYTNLMREACYNLRANGNNRTDRSLAVQLYSSATWAADRPLPLSQVEAALAASRLVRNWAPAAANASAV